MAMCRYGSCRIEWWMKEDKSSGPRKYCKTHSKIVNAINLKNAQSAYLKRLAPGVIAKRKKTWYENNPDYNRQYYLKRKKELNKD